MGELSLVLAVPSHVAHLRRTCSHSAHAQLALNTGKLFRCKPFPQMLSNRIDVERDGEAAMPADKVGERVVHLDDELSFQVKEREKFRLSGSNRDFSAGSSTLLSLDQRGCWTKRKGSE